MNLFFTLLLTSLFSASVLAEQARIAVASNFILPMKSLIETFEADSPYDIQASYGSSGKLFAQISHGAPFDIFLSADQAKPDALISKGLATAEHRFTYAQGKLVLWSRNHYSAQTASELLTGGQFVKVALANPKLAPYGAAAKSVLVNLSLEKVTRKKWVMGENISQVYSFVAYGSVDIGFVAQSQLNTSKVSGQVWQIPSSLYEPINQDAVLLMKSKTNKAAMAFWTFLHTDVAKKLIQAYGYETF
ncbi:molybdate ABC transporter substrate-binding protein [Thalassotalea sp. 1_MG-2023]|uniref:molybdate ABC transporter substrate-binding protein n=1 Tax=Thalassotalea sp. 1_MG-2023 TaxID=3062680 RepID=UPI0026E2AC23|nr:molybdate ABC transporter substrate-binding protein [Thalassotalea sp. 1_MG-2023]MDO6427118.1 molybdate ABC transporter substrate-binding protein [Thalassotalea sp. 1_MG-2023]